MNKKLKKQEILEMISKPDCVVRYLENPYLSDKEIFLCDCDNRCSVMSLETDYFMNKKIMEIIIQYKGETIHRLARPNAKWHRPVINDILEIYNAVKNKRDANQK